MCACPFTERVVNKPYSESAAEPYAGTEEKYCRCIAKTAAGQPKRCLPPRKAKSGLRPGCYNPYALCGRIYPKGHKGKVRCTEVYDYAAMPPEQIAAVAALHGKTVAELVNP